MNLLISEAFGIKAHGRKGGMKTYQEIEVKSQQELRRWLQDNHHLSESYWLVTHKKKSEHYLPYPFMVDELLCFGWIDSLPRRKDDLRTMRLISPRKKGSVWSKVNKEKVKKLEKLEKMTPAGRVKIRQAKKDGSWFFLDDVEALKVPKDLRKELQLYPKANHFFELFPPSAKKVILHWIKSAKREKTRERRIIEVAFLANENIRHNPSLF